MSRGLKASHQVAHAEADHRVGGRTEPRRLGRHPRTHAEPGDRRAFEDPDAVLDQQAPEASGKSRRVDGRRVGDQQPAAEPGTRIAAGPRRR